MIEAFGVIAFLLSICSFVCIIVAIIKPAIFTSLFKKNLGRKKTSLVFAGVTLALFVIAIVLAMNSPTSSTESPQKNNGQVTNNTVTVKPSFTSTPTPSITSTNSSITPEEIAYQTKMKSIVQRLETENNSLDYSQPNTYIQAEPILADLASETSTMSAAVPKRYATYHDYVNSLAWMLDAAVKNIADPKSYGYLIESPCSLIAVSYSDNFLKVAENIKPVGSSDTVGDPKLVGGADTYGDDTTLMNRLMGDINGNPYMKQDCE